MAKTPKVARRTIAPRPRVDRADAMDLAREALRALDEMTAVARQALAAAEGYRLRNEKAADILAETVAFCERIERDAARSAELGPLIKQAQGWLAVRRRAVEIAKRPRAARRPPELRRLDSAIAAVLQANPRARAQTIRTLLTPEARALAKDLDKKPFADRVRAQRKRMRS